MSEPISDVSRRRILECVRRGLRAFEPPPVPPPGPTPEETPAPDADLAALFQKRWEALAARFHRAENPAELETVLLGLLAPLAGKSAIVSDHPLLKAVDMDAVLGRAGLKRLAASVPEAATAEVGLTGAELALASTATLLLTGDHPGDLIASLLPPVHVALVPRSGLIHSLAQALPRLTARSLPRAAVLVTGPSKTGDIELTMVLGVHGPGQVHAVLLDWA
jgi:L-lactate dehydrogenase complex protein LldG